MAYDSAAMRQRFLDAAFGEFVQHGLAGARVDRIATKAGASKQAIYSYFGSKEGLFDAVLTQRHHQMIEAVPLTPDDLPGYAGAIYDYLTAHPEYARLTMWRRLERDDASAADIEAYQSKLDQLEQSIGVDTAKWGAIDVILLVLASANAWESMAPGIRNLDPDATDPADRHARQRRALIAAVTGALAALRG